MTQDGTARNEQRFTPCCAAIRGTLTQSFLNTIDAIQPVISAMKAVTSP